MTLARNGTGVPKYGALNKYKQYIQKVHSFSVYMKKKAPQTETMAPSYPLNTPLLFDFELSLRLSVFRVNLARNGTGVPKYGALNKYKQYIQKVHSFPVHMKKKAPRTKTVAPRYPLNTTSFLTLG